MRVTDLTTRHRPLIDPATLGGRLYAARSARHISVFQLANATEIGTATIQGLESGKVKTTPHCLRRLAIALEVDPDWLIHGREAA